MCYNLLTASQSLVCSGSQRQAGSTRESHTHSAPSVLTGTTRDHSSQTQGALGSSGSSSSRAALLVPPELAAPPCSPWDSDSGPGSGGTGLALPTGAPQGHPPPQGSRALCPALRALIPVRHSIIPAWQRQLGALGSPPDPLQALLSPALPQGLPTDPQSGRQQNPAPQDQSSQVLHTDLTPPPRMAAGSLLNPVARKPSWIGEMLANTINTSTLTLILRSLRLY